MLAKRLQKQVPKTKKKQVCFSHKRAVMLRRVTSPLIADKFNMVAKQQTKCRPGFLLSNLISLSLSEQLTKATKKVGQKIKTNGAVPSMSTEKKVFTLLGRFLLHFSLFHVPMNVIECFSWLMSQELSTF